MWVCGYGCVGALECRLVICVCADICSVGSSLEGFLSLGLMKLAVNI